MPESYSEWLVENGVKLYNSNNIAWRVYRNVLIPVGTGPVYGVPSDFDVNNMLSESGSYLIRSTIGPISEESPWWHVVADSHSVLNIKSKIKGMIKRGKRDSRFERLDIEWLIKNGYECYFSAHSRYGNARPASVREWSQNLILRENGPFEYWGAFCGSNLAAYAECVVDGKFVNTATIKFNPEYLKNYISYVMVDGLIFEYVHKMGMKICNGTTPVSHDTLFQEFLLKNGFIKEYGVLDIRYEWRLGLAVKVLCPIRYILKHLEFVPHVKNVNSLLLLEYLHRGSKRLVGE
jgi:hypothetical protein